jgi:hypothetical protein
MKKIAIILLCLFLFSCGNDEIGVDIGETTVSVSLKSDEEAPPDIMRTAQGMFTVFDSITRAMYIYDMPYSDSDTEFMWRTITMLLNYCGEAEFSGDGVKATAELIGDYLPACFNGKTRIPELADGINFNPESMVYTVPRLNNYDYDDYTVEFGDVLDNGDGTYSAYINYVANGDETIVEQYIFTLIDNPRADKNDESSNIMLYSVIQAMKMVIIN